MCLVSKSALGLDILDRNTVRDDGSRISELLEVFLVQLSETVLARESNLEATRELVLGATQGLDNMGLVRLTRTNGHNDLADVDTGNTAVSLTESLTHTRGQSIGTSARKLLVHTDNVERVDTNTQVETFTTTELDESLVSGDTSSFQSLRGDLLTLIADEMDDERELINMGFLVTNIVDTDLGI